MKVCVVTCYKDSNYIRARTLRESVRLIKDIDLIEVKNNQSGMLRYMEVLFRLLIVRLYRNPDIYILTFRGYEILLPVRLITIGKTLIYDEFINPIEWIALEHKKVSVSGIVSKLIKLIYYLSLRGKYMILSDTKSHADLSSKLMNIPYGKYNFIYVGTDESVFSMSKPSGRGDRDFTVFYYGNMLPLHGVKYVIASTLLTRNLPIKYVLVGGDKKVASAVNDARMKGANIEYKSWVNFEKLPQMMNGADVCLAGPFGGTLQSDHVITGKAYQYLAMGKPVIVGRNKESGAFTDKSDAIIVDQASPKSLASAIKWAYENKKKLDGIGRRGRKLYDDRFSNRVLSYQLQRVLNKVTDT